MRKSIRKKINYLVIISLVILSIFMVVINISIINSYTSRQAQIMMSKACDSQAQQLNSQFRLVEQSVKNIYDISEELRPNVEELRNKETTEQFISKFENIAVDVAENTNGALAIYYRMNPDITLSGVTGFFYVKPSQDERFGKCEVTDLLQYDVNDTEHVGWYYEPVWIGKPVWMEPYYNANIDVEIISYVVPIYDGNNLVGVVGMDVDFKGIKAIAENMNIFESSGAVLCSMSNSQIYFNECDLFGKRIPSDIYIMMQGNDASSEVKMYDVGGKKYDIYYETLDNRMKLLVYAKESEIYKQRTYSVHMSAVVFSVVLIVTIGVAMKMSRRITKPLTDISEASKKYAQGEWDVKVSCDTGDELQELTNNITIMAEKTKEYIEYINNMARKDALTGLRNKTDYAMYVQDINETTEEKQYAIVLFDVNNLKFVNDNYGHEKGDELIKAASQIICKFFPHSPVFRVGGDEFVAIVDSEDYETRDEIISEFHKYMYLMKNSTDIMDVCIACGMAVCGEDGEKYEDIFKIADKNMYDNKVKLKDGVKPR